MSSSPRQNRYSQTSFQLIDERGAGEPYAGLAYEMVDKEGKTCGGYLDAAGVGRPGSPVTGPVVVMFRQSHDRSHAVYARLMDRHYRPLEITELQVRAEQTRYLHEDGSRTRAKPACAGTDIDYYQVEVRHLVEHAGHLPSEVDSHYRPDTETGRSMGFGVGLAADRHTVLEVRPLRVLQPMFSTGSRFCALNLFQLALLADFNDCPFIQKTDHCDTLLVNDVAYSRRLEVVPCGPAQEHPGDIHFFDDDGLGTQATGAQAFVTYNDEVTLITVRSTGTMLDALQPGDMEQVHFEEGEGRVHRGFYRAARQVYGFVTDCLDRFCEGQKLLISGHGPGGAIALLLAQMLRCRPDFNHDIVLYTYGAPRAADAVFIKAAESLVHHRVVDHNDPVPSMPGSWMDVRASVSGLGTAPAFVNVPAGLSLFVAGMTRLTGEPYQHHGTLHYLMPVESGPREQSHILWEPVCETVTQHALCRRAIEHPGQLLEAAGHSPQVRYISGCREVLQRYREAFETSSARVTEREVMCVDLAFEQISQQLRTRYREAVTRPGKPVAQTINQLMRELAKVQRTREHLYRLRSKRLSKVDVYGE